ncbi:cytochrome P450 [Sporormia fimetaria CBS 119925]|uniref:Cytochrome P450 n=1 Tax=Sporormia fimetaria CBS 119925 TaxID=1340428 RepID=A0A6A6UZB2_9PLEO|nr:cytochrome P450 [Sporormia fimetaria CBS 119925]
MPDLLLSSGVRTAPVFLGLILVVLVLLSRLLSPQIYAQEPPVIHPRLPFIGHAVGMARRGPHYFKQLSSRMNSGIATLPMLNGRMYVVSSPELASQVQRASKTLDFVQLIVDVAPRMICLSKEGSIILSTAESKQKPGERMVNTVVNHVIHPFLTPTAIADIVSSQLQDLTSFLNNRPATQEKENLYRLLMNEFIKVTMVTFYGPENPFAMHPELVDDFLVWERDLPMLMIGVVPQWTARKQYLALQRIRVGFEEYITAGRFEQAYDLVRLRHQAHVDAGFSLQDRALMEIPMCLAFGINAAATSFWMVNNIFSRPELLEEIRSELLRTLEGSHTISYTKIRASCPLLYSTLRETLRLVATLSTTRVTIDDTIIGKEYLLKKGNIVQIIGSAIHADKEIWGADVDTFNPRRFYYSQNGTKTADDGSVPGRKEDQIHAAAFRSFGGGASLCPGRDFAAIELLTVTAALVLSFDITPAEGYKWDPPFDDKRFLIAVTKPKEDIFVNFKRRTDTEGVNWVLKY